MGKVPVYVEGDGAELWVEWMGKCKAESGWELVPREGTSMGEYAVSGKTLSYISQIHQYNSSTETTLRTSPTGHLCSPYPTHNAWIILPQIRHQKNAPASAHQQRKTHSTS